MNLFFLLLGIQNHSVFAATLSFDDALKAILARDTQVQIAHQTQQAVVGQGFYTRFHLLPTLSLEATDGSNGGNAGNGINLPNERITGINSSANIALFKFGADQAALDAALASERAVDFSVKQTILDEEKVAVQALIAWVRLNLESEVLQRSEHSQVEALATAQRAYGGGRIALQEVQKVEVDLGNVRSQIAEAEVNLENSRQELIRLLGHSDVQIAWPWKDRIKSWSRPEAFSVNDYLHARPDYEKAHAKYEAQNYLAKRAYRSMFPELDAKLNYGFNRDTAISDQYLSGWSVSLVLEIPLFNRFQDYSNYLYQSYARDENETAKDEVLRKMNSEFDAIPKKFLTARETAFARENLLQLSEHLYRDNLSRYQMGRASSNELNIDLTRYLDTERNAISGWALAHLAYVDVTHLLGKSVTQ